MDNDSIKVFQSNSTSSQKPNDAIKVWISNIDEIPGGGGGGGDNPTFVEGYGITLKDMGDGTTSINVTEKMPKESMDGNYIFCWFDDGYDPISNNVGGGHITWTRCSDIDCISLGGNEYGSDVYIGEGYNCYAGLIDDEEVIEEVRDPDSNAVTSLTTNHDSLLAGCTNLYYVVIPTTYEDWTYEDEHVSPGSRDRLAIQSQNKIWVSEIGQNFKSAKAWFMNCSNLFGCYICHEENAWYEGMGDNDHKYTSTNFPKWCNQTFANCTSLTNLPCVQSYEWNEDYDNLEYANVNSCFYNCSIITTGDHPIAMTSGDEENWRWNTASKQMSQTLRDFFTDKFGSDATLFAARVHNCFYLCGDSDFSNQIPTSWGGTGVIGSVVPQTINDPIYTTINGFDDVIGTQVSANQPNVGEFGYFGQNLLWWNGEFDWKWAVESTATDFSNAWYGKLSGLHDAAGNDVQNSLYFEMDEFINNRSQYTFNFDNTFRNCDAVNSYDQYCQIASEGYDYTVTSHNNTFTNAGNNWDVPGDWKGE